MDASLNESLQEISQAANRAASLTRQLLAFSRKQMLRPRALDLALLLDNLGKMLRRIIGEEIQLQIHCAENLPPVLADPNQFENAVLNLAINARDAMPQGGRLTIDFVDRIHYPSIAGIVILSDAAFALSGRIETGIYGLALGAMAGMAWNSRFPRALVGLGALLFAASDLLLFARMGIMAHSPVPAHLVWPLYFAGQVMIALGVVESRESRR